VHGKQFFFRDALHGQWHCCFLDAAYFSYCDSKLAASEAAAAAAAAAAPPVLLFSSASIRDITISIGSVVGVRLTRFVERRHVNSINITAETQVHSFCH
jgi:hypothetical protein